MKKYLCLCVLLMTLCLSESKAQAVCNGAFPNVIKDICWDCMFPIKLSGGILNFGSVGTDYDTGASNAPICACIQTLSVGSPMAFWEPTYMVDVTNKPGCMPLLGGADVNPPYNDAEFGAVRSSTNALGRGTKSAFMHVNEDINPVMTALGIITNNACLDSRKFDVPFLSWADPTWNDDQLSMLLTPYAYPFANAASVAAEMPDAIMAVTGFPSATMFWVAGAWGGMYPPTGNVSAAQTPEQVAHLVSTRLFAKLHAAGVQQTTAGQGSLNSCGAMGVPEFIMDKRQYKTNRVFPFPDNMCTPIGRPLALQEAGAARPQDKDYGYFWFRRKDCCMQ